MKVIIIILILLVVLPLFIGFLLPSERVFLKTAEFKSSPQEIWNIITDIKGQESWRNDIQSIHMIYNEKGAEKWTEIPKKGQAITFQVKTYQPPHRFDIEIVESPFSGYWEGRIKEENGVTSVEFKEVIIVKNPFFKIISYLVPPYKVIC